MICAMHHARLPPLGRDASRRPAVPRTACNEADQHAAALSHRRQGGPGRRQAHRPLTLGHSFATHLLEVGTDIRIIRVLLGHAKLNNTAFYTKAAIRTVRTVTSPLDKLGLFKPGEISPIGWSSPTSSD